MIMKKNIVFILVLSLALCLTAQRREVETEILVNRGEAGAVLPYYSFDNADEPESVLSFTIPHVNYQLETVQEEVNKFLLDAEAGFEMFKRTVDGNAPEGEDRFAFNFFADLNPRIRFYIPNEVFERFIKTEESTVDDYWSGSTYVGDVRAPQENKWYFGLGLPVSYSSITPQHEDQDAYDNMTVDISVELGYIDRQSNLRRLSPWAKFERGLHAYGLLEYRVSETIEGESPDKLPVVFGLHAGYSYDADQHIPNSMISGFMAIKYQMQDQAVKVFPYEYTRGFQGTYIDFSVGANFAMDINEQFNLTAMVAGTSWMLDDYNNNSINWFKFDTRMNYYPVPEVNVFFGLGNQTHLKEESKPTDIRFYLGGVYTIDFMTIGQPRGTTGSWY